MNAMRLTNFFGARGGYTGFLVILVAGLSLFACKQDSDDSGRYTYQEKFVQGTTMGTTYHIKFEETPEYLDYQFEIDSVLTDVNNAVSNYIPTSVISRFNSADSVFLLEKSTGDAEKDLLHAYFMANYNKSTEIWKLTKGAFDPTVGPLVNFWGFGTEGKKEVGQVDTAEIESIRKLVGMDKIKLVETMAAYRFEKQFSGIKLDFSALAKGFGIDEVCRLLEKRGIRNYMVEIGGEVSCKGVNANGNTWKLGISKPDTEAMPNSFYATILLENASMASSGNYRNYYVKDGIKRFHSINPRTGFPEENTMRSATIISNDCMTADALATACMVMGTDKAKSLVYTIDGIRAFLIYENPNGELEHFATSGVSFQLTQ